MTKEEAVAICYKYEKQYISDIYKDGGDGVEAFECLISILEHDTIKPEQIVEYGMSYHLTT